MINQLPLLPAADPIPLPAPVVLLKFLLLFTFFLHLVFMNFMLGGSFAAAYYGWRGKGSINRNQQTLSRHLMRSLPVITAFAVSFGVAPLLFLQVLYGQLFYTSSVIMAWPWLAVIAIIIVAYSGEYANALEAERLGQRAPWIALASALLFLLVAFLYVNNILTMHNPERWQAWYSRSPSGLLPTLGDRTLIPRWLHFVTAAFAVTGIFIIADGIFMQRKGSAEYGDWAVRQGALWLALPTAAQVLIGPLFLILLPREALDLFLGGSLRVMVLLGLGILFVLVGLILLFLAYGQKKPAPLAVAGSAMILVTVADMIVIRHTVREAYLSDVFRAHELAVKFQSVVFLIFAVLLVAGLAVIGWMLAKVLAAKPLQAAKQKAR